MSSIAAGANPERTNRWLLIGAVILAIAAGALIFVALANTVSNDDGGSAASGDADARALVAKDTIEAGTPLKPDMFRSVAFAEGDLVPGAIFDESEIDGLVTRADIYKNQQLSGRAVGVGRDGKPSDLGLSGVLTPGMRGVSVSVKEVTGVGGHLVPGDRVDLFINIVEKVPNAEYDLLHVVPAFQNVKVVARAQTPVESVVNLAEDDEEAADATSPDVTERPQDLDPDARAQTVTVELSPQDTQSLIQQMKVGDEVWLALRPFGDAGIAPLEEIIVRIAKNQ